MVGVACIRSLSTSSPYNPSYLVQFLYRLCLFDRKEANGKNYVRYEVIGSNNVAVPTHFFKVVAIETTTGDLELEAYVMPNQAVDNEIPLTSFQVCSKVLDTPSVL